MENKQWTLELHSYQIADTGDYDGHYELSIGKYVLHSRDEVVEDEWDKLQDIMKQLNEIPMRWWDPYEGADQHVIGYQQEQMELLHKYLKEKGLEAEYEKWYMGGMKIDNSITIEDGQ